MTQGSFPSKRPVTTPKKTFLKAKFATSFSESNLCGADERPLPEEKEETNKPKKGQSGKTYRNRKRESATGFHPQTNRFAYGNNRENEYQRAPFVAWVYCQGQPKNGCFRGNRKSKERNTQKTPPIHRKIPIDPQKGKKFQIESQEFSRTRRKEKG